MAPREPRRALAEPLARRDGVRPRIDWTARTRGTVLDAQRYSQFVGVMKRALPIAAGAVVMAVVAYTLVPRPVDRAAINIDFTNVGQIENDLAMIKPRLSGTDQKGNPFVITADAAIQDGKNTRRAQLRNVEADMTLENKRWLNATADTGFVDADAGKLSLAGGIALFSDNGYELHTNSVKVDLNQGQVAGNEPVTGQGPMGALKADRFTIDRRREQIQLYGHVQTTIYAGKK